MENGPLRHMTSATHLTSQRSPQRRLGSRSPHSIPSSPTSVHSSSSAIFERDIEPISPSSPPFPHGIPRAKGTEQLEHAVPSVLDSAALLLSDSSHTLDHITVVAPATSFDSILASGFTSPIGSFRSRSPSPLGLRLTLSSLPTPPVPAIVTPPSASPPTDTAHHVITSPPSPTLPPTNRLSFISYSDLLSSTPASTLPLSSLTTSVSSTDPPPHIPSVAAHTLLTPTATHNVKPSSAATSLRGFPINPNRDSIMDDVGGEWEREGLGRGLEERLETVIHTPPPPLNYLKA